MKGAMQLMVARYPAHIDGRNVPDPARPTEHVNVVLDHTLPVLGQVQIEPYGYTIRLRAWDRQVLVHELLHVLIDQHIPYDGPGGFNHRIVNTVEVGLTPHLERLLAVPA